MGKTFVNFFNISSLGTKPDKILCGSYDVHRNSPV